ncbi:hypothetical protein F5884DRAFT_167998 [Xylogone sp. PMI_703]|nr:hypothetical protein F5884DRAFT_167998 [Xylogone sp. PMI_703]
MSGPWVRLAGIPVSKLPVGFAGIEPSNKVVPTEGTGDGSGSTTLDLKTFVAEVLSEAIPFIDGVAPKAGGDSTWRKKGSPKKYHSSEAPVYLYENSLANETWFCRKSTHRNAREKGTASWDEFVTSFKEHHAESEKAFTPTVIGARKAMTWDTAGIEVDVGSDKWTDITLVVEEMKHKIDPKPLKNRTFPVLQLSANLAGTQEFLIVSIPLTDFSRSPFAEYARDPSLVVGSYVSVERVRVLPTNGEIEWIMATASNAAGVLPQWMQNMAVPGVVAKDVDYFLSWIAIQRKD